MAERRRIAIIDDDQSLRSSLGRLLYIAGFQPVLFSSAEEFLADPARTHLHCLLVDVRLGGMSGLALHERLIAEGCPLPVIYITAQDDPAVRVEALHRECAGFFRKSDPGDDIIAAVTRASSGPAGGRAHR